MICRVDGTSASGHLVYDVLLFFSIVFSLLIRPGYGAGWERVEKYLYWDQNPLSAALVIVSAFIRKNIVTSGLLSAGMIRVDDSR